MRTKKEFAEAIKNGAILSSLATNITNDFILHKDVDLANQQHKWLKRKSKDYELLFFENLMLLDFYEEALVEFNRILLSGRIFVSDKLIVDTLIKIRSCLNRNVVKGFHIQRLSLGWLKPLTKFGDENLDGLLEVLDVILKNDYQEEFFEQFYVIDAKGKIRSTHPKNYYQKFYTLGKQAKKELIAISNNLYKDQNGLATRPEVENAIGNACANLMREAENSLRIAMGGKRIGEGYISETVLYYKIKTHFAEFQVIQHGRPDFLGRQHFDVWIPEIKVAIEYQGAQHDRAVDFFGGEKAFNENRKRDKLKRNKCEINNVKLIEVRPGYFFDEVIQQIGDFAEK